ncbi:hypothetical protein ABTM77_21340, partial [Acinetobacter baumannii]
MRNIQIIDGAVNCVYDIFAATEEEFCIIFPGETDVAFIDEVYKFNDPIVLDGIFSSIWKRRIKKSEVNGI